jgi:CBS-domain-containing membrane protein
MQIENIMIKEVISVGPQTKIIDVSKKLMEYGFHAIPVIDEKEQLVGIITESDFFIKDLPEIYLPSYISFLKRAEFANKISKTHQKETQKLLKTQARDIMTSECITLKPTNEINELLKIFKEKRIHSVPIVNEENRLLGIVTQADIIKLVSSS